MANEKQVAMLKESFDETFKTGEYGDEFRAMFDKLSNDLSTLGFSSCFVDMSLERRRIDFNLWFDHGLFISVARPVDSTDNIDFFAISRNKKKIVIDYMDHTELMSKLKEAEEISRSDNGSADVGTATKPSC